MCFQALILERVGPDFLGETDSAAFLRQVDQDTASFAADLIERHMQLVAAVAAQRPEHIAGEAA